MIIGIVGTSGAGKSTVSAYLNKKHSFYNIELSSFLRKEAKKRKIKNITKAVLQDIGNDLRKLYGSSILVIKALELIPKRKKRSVVITGIRNLAEISYLKKQKNFYLLGINTPSFLRYQRILKLQGEKYIGSYKNFLYVERRDSQLGNSKYGLRVKECFKKATTVINNNDNRITLYQKVDRFINKTAKKNI